MRNKGQPGLLDRKLRPPPELETCAEREQEGQRSAKGDRLESTLLASTMVAWFRILVLLFLARYGVGPRSSTRKPAS
jgi:hypothetical protein